MYFDRYSNGPLFLEDHLMYRAYTNAATPVHPVEGDRLALAEFLGQSKISSWEDLIEHITKEHLWQKVLEWRIAS